MSKEYFQFETDAELEQDEQQTDGQAEQSEEQEANIIYTEETPISSEQFNHILSRTSVNGSGAQDQVAKPQPKPGVLTTLDDAYAVLNALKADKLNNVKPGAGSVKRPDVEQALETARKYYGIAKRSNAPEAAGSAELVKELEKFLAEMV